MYGRSVKLVLLMLPLASDLEVLRQLLIAIVTVRCELHHAWPQKPNSVEIFAKEI